MPKEINTYLGKEPTKVDRRHGISRADEWVKSGRRIQVRSSNVKAIAYDYKGKILYVEFKGGRMWRYNNVPPKTAKDMFNATSMGRFVWRRLRDVFPAEEVT